MKKIIYLGALALALTSCQQQQKIGYVDNGEVINNYKAKTDLEEKFKTKNDAFQKRTDSIGNAFRLEAQDFQLKSKTMSATKVQVMYDELGKKQQMLSQQLQNEQQQLQTEFQAEMDSVIVQVKNFVKEYGKSNGYSYIIGTTEASSTIMYGEEQNNLTETIKKVINEAYTNRK